MNPQEILKFLTLNPNQIVATEDDQKCKPLLLELGLINDFPQSDGPNMTVLTAGGHPTHWVLAACWSGYAEANGNGYSVCFIPKSKFSAAGLKDYVDDFVRQQGGTDRQDWEAQRSEDWPKHN
jgi:hypothetical protein